jgi:hypothetical protein
MISEKTTKDTTEKTFGKSTEKRSQGRLCSRLFLFIMVKKVWLPCEKVFVTESRTLPQRVNTAPMGNLLKSPLTVRFTKPERKFLSDRIAQEYTI